ncbi:MAG: 6-bladed beta-propeller [Bacteroidota bacterium]
MDVLFSKQNLSNYIFFFLVFLFTACSDSVSISYDVIDVNPDAQKSTLFSEIFKEVKYVRLEDTNPLIGTIGKILVLKDKYIIKSSAPDIIFIFSKDGKLINKIDSEGEGPEEYSSIKDIAYDSVKEEIIILDRKKFKLMNFDLNGKFIKSSSLPFYVSSFWNTENRYMLYCGAEITPNNDTRLIVTDKEVSKVDREFLKINPKQARFLNFFDRNNFVEFGDSIRFFYGFNDTIYNISERKITPRFIVDFGSYSLPSGVMNRDYESSYDFIVNIRKGDFAFRIIGYAENQDYISFSFEFRGEFLLFFYEKNTQSSRLFRNLQDDISMTDFYVSEVINFTPIHLDAENNALMYVEADALRSFIDEKKSSNDGSSISDLVELDKKISVGDNPILVVGKVSF